MATGRERELAAQVERLQAEVARLQAEVARLQEELARIGQGRRRQVERANAARSARSAATDDLVFAAVLDELQERYEFDVSKVDLSMLGYPHFRDGHLHRAVAAALNAKGVPAPRGGSWSTKQVTRALVRRAEHRSAGESA
ncbi:hypothetical protein DFH01_09740 [Falsiroseomonas bella]|uniref:Recombinase domain-containing protein n=1 Tax=Falsiroseomonas bella TaxID=2184016 RepID=A0A317FGR6_9PROT|nr:hypothetical protein [Falsiroseomonas bella]PWS37139.1 hypothetical protein DFH01_09740 [Falsiroseomonas bella]